jgi:hypothetical protein
VGFWIDDWPPVECPKGGPACKGGNSTGQGLNIEDWGDRFWIDDWRLAIEDWGNWGNESVIVL